MDLDTDAVAAYLDRIGAVAPERPDNAALSELQHRHLLSVPFENLSIHLGEPIVLEQAALLEKLVHRRRGGFCYELNGSFALLLSALDYKVTLLQAPPFGSAGPGPPFDHMALRVDLDEPWLVDVGFGRFSTFPLRLDSRQDQSDSAGTFRLVDAGYGDVDVLEDDRPQYRLEPHPRAIADFEPMCWWQQTCPESHFRQSLVC